MEPLSQRFVDQLAAAFKYNFGHEMSFDDMENYLVHLGWRENDAKIERLIYENRASKEAGVFAEEETFYEGLSGETAVL